uniref:Uncharacterized protein n=1 Tax=Oryza meridionalis TaxID=40149 RepID=A0A0E0E2W1_9ORYZ
MCDSLGHIDVVLIWLPSKVSNLLFFLFCELGCRRSPWSKFSMSLSRAQALIALSYRSLLKGFPKRMLSRTVPLCIHEFWETYATVPYNST